MMRIVFLLVMTGMGLFYGIAKAQAPAPAFKLTRFDQKMAFVAMDTVHNSQTTVMEYPNFLALIELPFVDAGGNKTDDLKQDTVKANALISFLKGEYPSKPVRYVFSSHWHLHSLSAVDPFLKNGAKLVTTSQNWKYAIGHGFTAQLDKKTYESSVIFVNKDTLMFKKSESPLQVLYLDSTYTNKPTKDYLFFYFPKQKRLHASCMCALTQSDLQKEKGFIYSGRLLDVKQAIECRKLEVKELIKLGRPEKELGYFVPPVFTYAYFTDYMKAGRSMNEAAAVFVKLPVTVLRTEQDSLLRDLAQSRMSSQVLNQAVYTCIKDKQYEKAVSLARLLNLYYPGVPSYIDTMGEACYNNGDRVLAEYYNKVLLNIDPKFSGGLKTWEANAGKH